MKHLQHFGLNVDPFRNEPDLRGYLETRVHRDALQRVERAIRQSKGLTALVGAAGAGKSLVLRQLLEGLEEEIFEAVLLVLVPGAVDGSAMLGRFARQLGVEAPAAEQTALVAQLYEQLAIVREDGRHSVLIIDDAHFLGPGDALLEVAGLLNLEYEERRLLSLVLVGLPDLEALLAKHQGLAGRLDALVRLGGLDRKAAKQYFAHRIQHGGGAPEILPPSAIDLLLRLGGGHPGQMNRLADNALYEAFLAGRSQVADEDVERAARDLTLNPDAGASGS